MQHRRYHLAMWRTVVLMFLALAIVASPKISNAQKPRIPELLGREVEALVLATAAFKASHASRSGTLQHYTIEIERRSKEIEIAFVPDIPPLRRDEAATGGETIYGLEVVYTVSLDPPKIIRYHLAR